MSKVTKTRERRQNRRRHHVRKKISGTPERPRLTVHKSLRHVYAQLVDDIHGVTLAMVSSVNYSFPLNEGKKLTKKEESERVGAVLAEKAREKGITEVVFDRNYNLYHGRIKALADGARKEGLKF